MTPAPTVQAARHPPAWLCLPLWLVAMAYAGLTTVLMLTVGLREPYSDQWRQQLPLLTGSLPDSVLHLESGHRQVLPNLLRLADLTWSSGHGELLAWCGAGLFAGTWLLFRRSLCRANVPAATRWLALAAVALGMGFLAQGRMLLHPNESVQLGGVYLGLALALHAALRPPAWRPLLTAILAATAATFCFGTGFAVHGALVGVLVLLRRFAHAAVAGVAAAGALWLYRSGLPAADALATAPALDPLPLLANLPRWLGAPFVQAFFGLADPAFQGSIAAAVAPRAPHGGLWVQAATGIAAPLGSERTMHVAAMIAGAAGLLLLVRAAWQTFQQRVPTTALHALGLGLALFGAGAGGIVCLARTGYFAQHADQIFAERYLVWSCLFWSGLFVHHFAGSGRARPVAIGTAMLAGIAVLLWPVQRAWISWTIVQRNLVERAALAARLGIDDPAITPPAADLGAFSYAQCVAVVRDRKLQMFAEPAVAALGTTLPVAAPTPTAADPIPSTVVPTATGTFLHATFDLPPALLAAPGQEWPLVDGEGRVVGRLRADDGSALLRRLPQPPVSRRGNCYVQHGATGPLRVVTVAPPHQELAQLRF